MRQYNAIEFKLEENIINNDEKLQNYKIINLKHEKMLESLGINAINHLEFPKYIDINVTDGQEIINDANTPWQKKVDDIVQQNHQYNENLNKLLNNLQNINLTDL